MAFEEPRTPPPAMSHLSTETGEVRPFTAFIGPLGLRAGWGILIYLLLAGALMAVLGLAMAAASRQPSLSGKVRPAHGQSPAAGHPQAKEQQSTSLKIRSTELGEGAQAGAALAAAVLLCFLEKRRFGVYGLPARHVRDALPGAVFGAVAISLLIGALRALHVLFFDAQLLKGTAILRYGLGWLAVFLLVGVFEEFLFRGYIQFTLMRGLLALGRRVSPAQPQKAAFWMAALIWSLLFCVTHLSNAGEDPMGIISVFAAGIVFSYALWRTGSLWWGIGFHMTWNWGQSFLYGVPDSGHVSVGRLFATHTAGPILLSGGTAGPEGSLLVLPVLALVILVLRLHPQAAQPPVEPSLLPRNRGTAALTPIP